MQRPPTAPERTPDTEKPGWSRAKRAWAKAGAFVLGLGALAAAGNQVESFFGIDWWHHHSPKTVVVTPKRLALNGLYRLHPGVGTATQVVDPDSKLSRPLSSTLWVTSQGYPVMNSNILLDPAVAPKIWEAFGSNAGNIARFLRTTLILHPV